MWWGAIKMFFGFISGPLSKITEQIIQLKIQQSNAQTEQDRIRAGEEVAVLQARRDVMLEENKKAGLNAFIRLGFALPCMVYLWQVIVYDKVVSMWITGRSHDTEDLSTNLWWILTTVITFYFLTVMTTHSASAIARGLRDE